MSETLRIELTRSELKLLREAMEIAKRQYVMGGCSRDFYWEEQYKVLKDKLANPVKEEDEDEVLKQVEPC